MQVKLDEIIRAIDTAHNALLDLEQLDQKELADLRKHYERFAKEARSDLRSSSSGAKILGSVEH